MRLDKVWDAATHWALYLDVSPNVASQGVTTGRCCIAGGCHRALVGVCSWSLLAGRPLVRSGGVVSPRGLMDGEQTTTACRRAVATAFTLAAAAAVLTVSQPAQASTAAGPGSHCVAAAPHVRAAAAPVPRCFTSFAAAVRYATNGRVQLSNARNARAVSAAELSVGSTQPLATGPISIMYADYNFGGSSFIWTGSACTSSNSYANGSMPSGWNDRVGSVRTYLNCRNDLYWDVNYGPPGVSHRRQPQSGQPRGHERPCVVADMARVRPCPEVTAPGPAFRPAEFR